MVISFLRSLESELSHSNKILRDFEKSLFALLSDVVRPENEILVDLLDRLLQIPGQLYLLPHLVREGRPANSTQEVF